MTSSFDSHDFAGDGAFRVQFSPKPCLSLREHVRQVTDQIEAAIILRTLREHQWNRRRTAEALHISYRSLMYKMKRCNVRSGKPATIKAVE
jgi:transcriptional regulator with PAS, ATPase and Fis domain